MTTPLNAASWSTWAGAATLAVVTTRNPLYLTLVGASAGAAYVSLDRGTAARGAWRLILRIGLVVAVVGVLFNLLTVHSGDRVLLDVPGVVPIVGGPLTLNALVYGVSSAMALLDLLLIAATFSAAVDRPSLLRLVPERFVAPGVAAIVALSVFPQTLRAAAEVREAQATRGFQVRSPRDVVPLLVPTLRLGLEHAFDLAEAMESRAFGSGMMGSQPARFRLGIGLLTGCGAIVLFGLAQPILAGSAALAAAAALLWPDRSRHSARERYRLFTWRAGDVIVIALALLAGVLLVAAVFGSTELAYAPYPTLGWPAFAPAPAAADLALVGPAVVGAIARS